MCWYRVNIGVARYLNPSREHAGLTTTKKSYIVFDVKSAFVISCRLSDYTHAKEDE